MTSQRERFQVIPAVDILGTEAVRLLRGDYDEVTLREADPFALIERVAAAGAEIVHVVDLSAARAGGVRPELVARRGRGSVSRARPGRGRRALDRGTPRRSWPQAPSASSSAPQRSPTAAFSTSSSASSARGSSSRSTSAPERVAVDGWTRATSFSVPDAVERVTQAGTSRLLCTAIERDGTLGGPSLDLLAEVCALSGLPVLAAGGIRSPDDLRAIEAVGCEGAIVGRALLEGLVPLAALGSRSDE